MCLPYLLLSIVTLLYILAVYYLVTFGAVLILCSVAILTFYKFITLSSYWLQHMHTYHTSYKALGKNSLNYHDSYATSCLAPAF